MTTLAIVIVSYNARADLERCLASLHHAPPSATFEIVVVDNASTDGSPAAARAWPEVRVIESPRNVGFSAASNLGMRATSSRLVLLLNSDTIVGAGAIDGLVEALDRRADVAAVGPRLVDADGRAELSFGDMLTPLTEWRRQRLMRALAAHEPQATALVESLTRQEHFPDWVSGACLLVRRGPAEDAGLLDERYFMYTEDADFCAALRARGHRVLFTPAVQITHVRGRSASSAPAATRAAYRRSHIAFYRKHHPALAPLVVLYHWIRG